MEEMKTLKMQQPHRAHKMDLSGARQEQTDGVGHKRNGPYLVDNISQG